MKELMKSNSVSGTRPCAKAPDWLASCLRLWLAIAVFAASLNSRAADARATAFDQANKLYEQARYPEAITAYETLAASNAPDAALLFNLGNAQFKAGHTGLAIAAYRRAQELAPRDPSLRFNLQFARKSVTGTETAPGRFWQRALASLTLNEWTVLAALALALWCGLLAWREWRPAIRPALRGYTAAAGVLCGVLAGCTAAAFQQQFGVERAVIVVPEAIVRVGPLDEAKELAKFRDGTEVELLDRKEIAAGSGRQLWRFVQSGTGQTGWVKDEALAPVR
jgi:tetratricopeptide (TPR) repeat protein